MLIVAALTAVGVALRLAVANQSLFADELSTRYMVAGRSLDDVISVVHTDAEITPPLSFVASWFTTRIDFTPELLRAPSLVAGAADDPAGLRARRAHGRAPRGACRGGAHDVLAVHGLLLGRGPGVCAGDRA